MYIKILYMHLNMHRRNAQVFLFLNGNLNMALLDLTRLVYLKQLPENNILFLKRYMNLCLNFKTGIQHGFFNNNDYKRNYIRIAFKVNTAYGMVLLKTVKS